MSQQPLNRDPKVWGEDAEEFRPERFDPGYGEPMRRLRPSQPVGVPNGPPFGFVPFGAGQRTCVGQRLALMEGTMLLASIVKNFSFELAGAAKEVVACADVTLGPKEGLWVVPAVRSGGGGGGHVPVGRPRSRL